MLTILVCGTPYVILDLDQPRRGFIQIGQEPMFRAKALVDRAVEKANQD